MEHDEFARKWKSGEIEISVDKSAAGHLMRDQTIIPQKYRVQQAVIRSLSIGGVLTGAVLFFFVSWYIALIVLVIGFLSFPICQKHAAKSVLNASISRAATYKAAVDSGVLRVVGKN